MKKIFQLLIKFYQIALSPYVGNVCRFYPSCSNYAMEAFEKHGVFFALYLTLHRLLRCGPWCLGGVDQVPESKKEK